MNSFWELTRFEFRKIFRKKSTLIVFAAAALLAVFSCHAVLLGYSYVEGEPAGTKLEAMKTDRAYKRALGGRAIDSELLLEMAQAYAKIPTDGKYTTTEEYKLYAMPYSVIYMFARLVYDNPVNKFLITDAQALTREQADSFYHMRTEKVAENTKAMVASDATKARLIQLNSQIETPLAYSYDRGYARFFTTMYTTGMLACFVAAIILAPLFAGEYSSGTDHLILSSKHGKRNLIYAKLFTGITLTGGLSLFLSALTYLQCMLTYGFDGAKAALQITLPFCAYPLTIGQAALLYILCIFMGCLFSAAVTILLSAKMKTPFGAIVLAGILIIVPMFISDTGDSALFSNLLCLLPSNMMRFENVTTPQLFEFGTLVIEPYIIMPLFAGVMTIILLPFAYHEFKNHQIG